MNKPLPEAKPLMAIVNSNFFLIVAFLCSVLFIYLALYGSVFTDISTTLDASRATAKRDVRGTNKSNCAHVPTPYFFLRVYGRNDHSKRFDS